ncbi:zinc finger MYM-type protein 1-like [Haematobia irritans]|uniref:zinc finger MYM-type protein 1-like n=1 Tax=Haematobia irritans TaxID=7368 RepID=UPI003F5023E0
MYENENTEYLNKLIGIVLLLARQGLPFRGHREHSNSKNRGNFLEFAEFMSQNDSVFKTNFNKSINHTSPDFQNEIIELSAKAVTNVIVEKVKACGFFSLMVDEARCFKEEQLSITIRFAVGVEVEEHFLCFIDCSVSRDASSLQKIILEFLKIRNLENIPIGGQSYDGANVMSGYKNGLQMKIKESNPQAVFIHCLAHKLNLVIGDSCSDLQFASRFVNAVEVLYSHFSKPGNQSDLKRISNGLIANYFTLQSLSTTRWSCRYENCKAIITNYTAIKNALDEEANADRDKNSIEALSVINLITTPDFIVCLHIFHFALKSTQTLSKYFQTKTATFGEALDTVTSMIKYRFKSLPLAKSINAFGNLNLKGASEFIENYKNCLQIDTNSLLAEALLQ